MKILLPICFTILAVALLVTGYTADARFNRYLQNVRIPARAETQKFADEMKAKHPLTDKDDLTSAQQRAFEEIEDRADYHSAHVAGVVQYCAGWVLLGVAALLGWKAFLSGVISSR